MKKIEYESVPIGDDKYALRQKWTKKPEIYLLRNFDNREIATQRANQLSLLRKGEVLKIERLNSNDWAIVITENILPILNQDEKTTHRLIRIPKQTNITAYVPPVYRYLEKKWVNEFFETGRLRIGSFTKFKNHEDSQRQDIEEGNNILISNLDNDMKIEISASVGTSFYVLCASLLESQQMYKDFEVDGCFAIENPLEFIKEIAKQIQNVDNVLFGPCLYKSDRKIVKYATQNEYDKFFENCKENELNYDNMFKFMDKTGGNDVYFLKHNSYSNQHEYRFLWHVDAPETPEYIDVVAPDARKYCRKIE